MTGPEKQTYNPRPRTVRENIIVAPRPTEVKHLLGLAKSQCTYRCVVLPDQRRREEALQGLGLSQCTYRCVVLPDFRRTANKIDRRNVSMHLQVRGAP